MAMMNAYKIPLLRLPYDLETKEVLKQETQDVLRNIDFFNT